MNALPSCSKIDLYYLIAKLVYLRVFSCKHVAPIYKWKMFWNFQLVATIAAHTQPLWWVVATDALHVVVHPVHIMLALSPALRLCLNNLSESY